VRKYSTDEAVLGQVKHPIGKLILEKRSLGKLDGTYVLGLCRKGTFPDKNCGSLVHDDGLVHTNFNIFIARTGRTSSDSPNLQNFPKREHKEIRGGVGAPPNNKMGSIDYGRVIGMASRCPVLCRALWEHYDIHGAWAKRLADAFPYVMVKYLKLTKQDETKALKAFRGDIKNQWTFPAFFGSRLPPIAEALGIPARNLEPHFDEFWDMFAEVKRWQERTLVSYKKKGYTETLTGRRRYEPLSLNEIINSPIQGTASDIVVNAWERLALKSHVEQRPQLAARINVHDDLTFYIPEATIDKDIADIVEVMCQPPFDFINVPITVEIGIGDTWGTIEDVVQVESTEFGFPKRGRL
jgi:DNA polymerase I